MGRRDSTVPSRSWVRLVLRPHPAARSPETTTPPRRLPQPNPCTSGLNAASRSALRVSSHYTESFRVSRSAKLRLRISASSTASNRTIQRHTAWTFLRRSSYRRWDGKYVSRCAETFRKSWTRGGVHFASWTVGPKMPCIYYFALLGYMTKA